MSSPPAGRRFIRKNANYFRFYSKLSVVLDWIDDPVSRLLILNTITSQETCYSIRIF